MDKPTDFFISYTGKDRAWAEWIAWMLEEAGHTTIVQAWDFKAASNFVLRMQSGTTDTARTVAVLTPDYFKSAFTQPEWAAAFVDDPKSENGKLIVVRVADFQPPGLFKAIVYIDLVGLEESVAKDRLIKSVDGVLTGKRLKPDSKPVFPGAKSSTTRPPFPGTPTGSKTFLHNLPFAPNPFFTGRDQMLDDLHAALQKKTAAAITQPQAVHGLGGVGKTQLATEYAWKYQTNYDTALWATASSSSELHAKIAALAAVLSLPEAEAKEQEIKVQAVLEWLRSHERWLLILDNADTKEAQDAVLKLLPPGLHGHVIVTSRIANWPVGYEDLEVSVLPEPAATEFLLKRARKGGFNPGTEADALAVAKELGYLPLALEQAAAYVIRHRVTFADYLKRLETIRKNLLSEPTPGGTGYPRSVAETWLASEAQLSLAARAILRLAAFLSPADIPRFLVNDQNSVLNEAVQALATEIGTNAVPLDAEAALVELADYSLITLETAVFSCHRLVQAVQSERLADETRRRWTELALRCVNDAVPSNPPPDDVRSWPVMEHFLVHAETVATQAEKIGITDPTARLLNQLGLFLRSKALCSQAEPLMRRAVSIFEKSFGEDHPNVGTTLNNLATLLQDMNRLDEAESLIQRALAIDEKSLGPDHPNVGTRLNNLAALLQATNRLGEAEPLMRRALTIDEKNSGPDHPNVAIRLNNLAQLLQATNRLGEAEPLMRRALTIDEKSFDSDHPNVARGLNNLAALLQATNRLGEAEPLMRRVVSIFEKSFGENHPNVGTSLSNLALLLQATNRLGEAEPLMRRALAIDEKNFGENHPNVGTRLNNLALLLKVTNRLGEAEPLMRRALAVDEKSFGPDHPNVAIRLNNLAQLLQDTNRLGEAEPLIRRVVSIFEKSFGENHPYVGTSLNNLAQLLQATNRLDEAEPLMRRALAIDEKSFGPDHPNVARDLNNLAALLKDTNRLTEAEPLMRRALAIDEKSFGPDHPDVARDLNNLGQLLQASNRLGEAEPLMQRALAIDEKSFGPQHPDVARDLNNLARLLQATNRLAEAEPQMRRALSIFHRSFGSEHPNTRIVLGNYRRLLTAMKLSPEQTEAKVREAIGS